MNSNFESYSLEDFICDESFQQWAKSVADTKNTRLWNERYEKHSDLRPLMDRAKAAILELSRTESPVDKNTVSRAWQELEERIEVPVRTVPMRRYLGYAAVLAMAIIGSVFLLDYWPSSPEYTFYSSGFGEKREVKLPDGTVVTLNANSSIKVSADWEAGGRNVWMEKGEAFFEVKKTTDKQQFVVHSKGLDITVLGTQFNVNQRTSDIKVMLKEGKVRLEANDTERIMAPGELAVYSGDGSINIRQVRSANYDSWLRNKIVFDNTTLTEVAKLMQDHYGVEVILDETLADRKISGEIPNENLDLLLEALKITLEIEINQSENEVIIRPI